MENVLKSEWLAELLSEHRDLITEYWIRNIRAEDISGYQTITDEQLRKDLPPTVDSMIQAFWTGDTEGPRQHSVGIIRRRLSNGFLLPDLQKSLHALQTSVMMIVREAGVGVAKELEALYVSSLMYYLVALIAAAVYEQLRIEQQTRFTTAYDFGTTLSRNLNLSEILHTAVRKIAEYVRADSVAILLSRPEYDRDELRAHYQLDSDLAEALPDICQALGCGIMETGPGGICEEGCRIDDVLEDTRLEKWSAKLVTHDRLSLMCMPLCAKQKHLGHLVVMCSQPHAISDTEQHYLLALSTHIANAVQNAILYEEAQGKRELGVLLNASRLFASSLDTQDILTKIARLSTEAIRADLVIVYTRDYMREHPRRAAFYIGRRMSRSMVSRITEAITEHNEESGFERLGRNFVEGRADLLNNRSEFPECMAPVADVIGSALIIPLRQKDETLGAFALISTDANAFTDKDLLLATGLADLAAVAIENARLYEHERNIAETLQRSLIPSELPEIEGYEMATFYRPAMVEAEVGGDFYDIFSTGEGRISIIIGDVSGKGLAAAIPTAMGKYMVRAYAAEYTSPSSLMMRFNRTFCDNVPKGMFMTAFYATLDPQENTFTYASAGHNPPLLYTAATGEVREIHTEGVCLGIVSDATYTNTSLQLQPGDVLLLFTDGATDVKQDGNRLDVEGLEELFLASAHRSADAIVHDISDGIWDFGGGRLPDDVALVVVKRCG